MNQDMLGSLGLAAKRCSSPIPCVHCIKSVSICDNLCTKKIGAAEGGPILNPHESLLCFSPEQQ